MSEGDPVLFSAKLIDGMREHSMTEKGGMIYTEFIVRFLSITR